MTNIIPTQIFIKSILFLVSLVFICSKPIIAGDYANATLASSDDLFIYIDELNTGDASGLFVMTVSLYQMNPESIIELERFRLGRYELGQKVKIDKTFRIASDVLQAKVREITEDTKIDNLPGIMITLSYFDPYSNQTGYEPAGYGFFGIPFRGSLMRNLGDLSDLEFLTSQFSKPKASRAWISGTSVFEGSTENADKARIEHANLKLLDDLRALNGSNTSILLSDNDGQIKVQMPGSQRLISWKDLEPESKKQMLDMLSLED